MKYIFETYGYFLLEGIVVMLVLGLLWTVRDAEGNTGILKMLGGKWSQGYVDNLPDTGYGVYEIEASKDFPSVKYEYDGMIYAGEELLLTSFLKLQGDVRLQLRIRVLGITDSEGQDKFECYDENTGKINFPTEGIYQVKVSVKDAACKKYTCAINVPVNKRG